jgi:hypothetical protein
MIADVLPNRFFPLFFAKRAGNTAISLHLIQASDAAA